MRIFIDMDGTLAEFNPTAPLEKLYEKGYFENLKPQENIVKAVKKLIKTPGVEVFSCSAVFTDSHYALIEKELWLAKHLPELDQCHRVYTPCGRDKKDFIPNGVSEEDILFDDYTNNLLAWPGKGIKLLNGINGNYKRWMGNALSITRTPSSLCKAILAIANGTTIKDTRPQEEK